MFGIRSFPFGMAYFQVLLLLVSGRVSSFCSHFSRLRHQTTIRDFIAFPKNNMGSSVFNMFNAGVLTRVVQQKRGNIIFGMRWNCLVGDGIKEINHLEIFWRQLFVGPFFLILSNGKKFWISTPIHHLVASLLCRLFSLDDSTRVYGPNGLQSVLSANL